MNNLLTKYSNAAKRISVSTIFSSDMAFYSGHVGGLFFF
jgi:hypothetical protein